MIRRKRIIYLLLFHFFSLQARVGTWICGPGFLILVKPLITNLFVYGLYMYVVYVYIHHLCQWFQVLGTFNPCMVLKHSNLLRPFFPFIYVETFKSSHALLLIGVLIHVKVLGIKQCFGNQIRLGSTGSSTFINLMR